MKTVIIRIFSIFFLFVYIKNYGQKSREYCFNSTDKVGIKTELTIKIFEDSTYLWKAQILSSPNYDKIKKIEGDESGKIRKKNKKLYLISNTVINSISEFEIKLTKSKLVFIPYNKQKKILNSKHSPPVKKLVFKNNLCKNNCE